MLPSPLVRRRLARPEPPAAHVARPRIDALLRDLTAEAGVVAVTATAGAGKSTAVAAFAASSARPVAWLTADASDAATGRLLAYLAAAVDGAVPGAAEPARAAVAAGLPHVEIAGLLAEAVAGTGLVLVVDETERWHDGDPAWDLLGTYVRFADPAGCVVLIGRREPPAAHLSVAPERLRGLGDAELALTVEEATAALHARGAHDVDPRAAVGSTGGWMTGVLFEAWRAADHIDGMGGESDPLNGYLSSHILGQLDDDVRTFLVDTAVLDEVTASRASALGVSGAEERLAALRRARIPAAWSPDGERLRCHTRFREYLLTRLRRRGPVQEAAVRRALGDLLAAEGHDEEAVDEYLAAGESGRAATVAARAVLGVADRGDLALAGRWLAELGDAIPATVGPLTVAGLMVAIGREDVRGASRIVDRLEALGSLGELVDLSPDAAALVAWTYLHTARVEEFSRLMRETRDEHVRIAMQHVARVVFDQPGPARDLPPLTGAASDPFVLVAQYCLGRVGDLASVPVRGWADVVASPWVLAAIRDSGQTRRAMELYEAAAVQGPSLVLDVYVGPELLMDAGLPDRARACADRGVALAEASGSLGLLGLALLSKVRIALRVDRDSDAADLLLDEMRARGVDRFAFIAESMTAWRGLARLRRGDVTGARCALRHAVACMHGGDRILELPAAAVWLAEAEWRAGDEDAADDAVALALSAADRQGSDHLLVGALRAFPAVLARQLDTETDPDARWFEIARAVRSGHLRLRPPGGSRLHVREFGRRTLELDGEEHATGIAKAHEILAAFAATGGEAMSRPRLMEMVFDGRTDRSARTYFRQALSRLGQSLPGGVVEIDEHGVRLAADTRLTSDSQALLDGLAEIPSQRRAERLEALTALLGRWSAGPYLPGVRGGWADVRERELRARVAAGADDAAVLAHAAGEYAEAERHARLALDCDPFLESAWRTLMRLHHALGDEPGVIAAYSGCHARFAEIGTEPSASTRRLLSSLRR